MDAVGVATGVGFPDALAGGAVIGAHGGVMLTTRTDVLSAPAKAFLSAQGSNATTVTVFGSEVVVSGLTMYQAERTLASK